MEELGSLIAKLGADVSELKAGLAEGRQQLGSFQQVAQQAGQQVRRALEFAGLTLGIGALIYKLREFGASVLEAGAKAEQLRESVYAIGRNYQVSAGSIDYYIEQLTRLGVAQEKALAAISGFMKAGISIDFLPALARAARDIGPSLAMSTNEAFQALTKAIATGMPRALVELVPGIRQVMQAAGQAMKEEFDTALVSLPERAQMMLEYVLTFAERVKGVGDSVSSTYLKQLNDYNRMVRESKEAFFEMVKPIAMAVTGEKIKAWQDLYAAVGNNKEALKDLGEAIGVWVGRLAGAVRGITAFIAAHKELAAMLLQTWVAVKVLRWAAITEGAATAAVAVGGLTAKLGILRAALGGPWALVIAVSILGAMEAMNQLKKLSQPRQAELRTERGAMMIAPPPPLSADQQAVLEEPEVKAFFAKPPESKSPEQAKQEADAAAQKEAALWNQRMQEAAKGGRAGRAAAMEDLLGEYHKLLEAMRQAAMAAAQGEYDIFKAAQEQKKADLERQLAEGLITGEEYYQALAGLEQEDYDRHRALIDQKIAAEREAYQQGLEELRRQEMSPEMLGYKEQALAAAHRQRLNQLQVEQTKTVLEHEKRLTEELKRQVEERKKIDDLLGEQADRTALGPLEEHEARINALLREQLKAREELQKLQGLSPAEYQKFLGDQQRELFIARYGEQIKGFAEAIARGFSDLIDNLLQGGQDLTKSLNSLFKTIFKQALEPGFKALLQYLTDAFKNLFGQLGAGLANALMGVMALIGMALTSGGGSSWSSSGATGGVTSHEAVRGIIAGETSIPIAKIGESLQDALIPTNNILGQIEKNTRGGGGASAGGGSISLIVEGLEDSLKKWLDDYFASYYLTQGG
jgi:hypothetical protein